MSTRDTSSPICLSIAGSDPSAGAGIQLDSRVFVAHGCYPTSIPALLTAQNSRGVVKTQVLDAEFLALQVRTLLDDLPPQAAKIGAIGTTKNLEAALALLSAQQIPVVLDPIFHSSNAKLLLDCTREEFFSITRDSLYLCTPNIPEAEFLLDCRITSLADMRQAAIELQKRLNAVVLLKGGHLSSGQEIIDVLAKDESCSTLPQRKVSLSGPVHGTGCALSAAITANLARKLHCNAAIALAKEWLTNALTQSTEIGSGALLLNFDLDGKKNE